MSYCIYLRKSRADMEAEARGEGETLARHERILLELAKKLKLNITQIYKEIVSGETISSRPVMQQLLSDVEQGAWDGVLVMEVERLARGDTVDQGIVAQTFKYSDTKIITPMKTYNPANEFDEEYFEFGLFMSRREYKTTNRRLQQGRLQSVKEGKYLGTRPPYGYIRKKLEKDKGYTLEINPEQANIVKMIFDFYAYKQIGVSLIVRKLNDLRIPPMRGDVWVPASIRDILRNPVYIGKIRWNSRPAKKRMVNGKITKERPRAKDEDIILVEGLHDAIIDIDTWNKVQNRLSSNSSFPVPDKYTVKNPLAGLVECGMCGRKMVRRPYQENPDVLMCALTSCNNVSSHLEIVENHLLKSLEAWLYDYKIEIEGSVHSDSNQIHIDEGSLLKIDEEIKTLEKQLDSLYDLLEQGIYTTEKFLERSKNISERIKAAQEDKELIQKEISRTASIYQAKRNIIPKVEHVVKYYNSTDDPAIKNEWLKEVLEKVIYTKEVGGRWSGKTDDFKIKLVPKLPRSNF